MNKRILAIPASILIALLGGCSDDGKDGLDGSNGVDGIDALITQTQLAAGDTQCFKGGIRIDSGQDSNRNGLLEVSEINQTTFQCHAAQVNLNENFNRIASFPVCLQIDNQCNTDEETAAEIAAVSSDGMTLIYSDSPSEQIGFVDISNPNSPSALGTLALTGEPTSVATLNDFALVAVNTSQDYVNVSGQLDVVDIASQTLVTSIDLGGQPDSIAVSPDGQYAAVVIENERDEDLGDGEPPQLPAGELIVIDLSDSDPDNWSLSRVSLTGLADLYADDPEPEYVDINSGNQAVVTLQENNHIVIVDLASATVTESFSAGTVDLNLIDATEGDGLMIEQTESLTNIPREPDGVSWINNDYFATADEGDLNGGSREFTVFHRSGEIVWSSGASLDHYAARFGHYPDARSGNKGNEPENIELGIFGEERYLFVNSERSSLIFVYDVADPTRPLFKQVLPAAAAPEGGVVLPSRNLLFVASEEDNRDDKMRSVINVYQYNYTEAYYPTIASSDRENGTPIPWAALSGLAADNNVVSRLYAVEDSFYNASRIFTIDTSRSPARITTELRVNDEQAVFENFAAVDLADSQVDDDDPTRVSVFDIADLAAMINQDKTVNLDLEGIAQASDGGYWLASEGSGTIGDTDRPINSLNFIFKTDEQGTIEQVITLPESLNNQQVRFGFEGIAEYDDKLYVAIQRAWGADGNPRIGIYDLVAESWSFVFYPLDSATSQNGGWVGLSDISSLGNGRFLVLERDNQAGPDASIKRIYEIDLSSPVANSTITKSLVRDLMSDLTLAGGLVVEKVEGLTVALDGKVYVVNDNDGVDDNSGETQLINLGSLSL